VNHGFKRCPEKSCRNAARSPRRAARIRPPAGDAPDAVEHRSFAVAKIVDDETSWPAAISSTTVWEPM